MRMTLMRALFLASLLGGLALVACGGAGSGGTGGAYKSPAPVLGTDKPQPKQYPSPTPSSDPYSGYGY